MLCCCRWFFLALPGVLLARDPINFITGGVADLAAGHHRFWLWPSGDSRHSQLQPEWRSRKSRASRVDVFPLRPRSSPGSRRTIRGTGWHSDGRRNTNSSQLSSFYVARLAFLSTTIPAPPIGAEALLSAPFTVVGSLSAFDFPQRYQIVGRGTATVRLIPDEVAPEFWKTDRAHYEFANAAGPDPIQWTVSLS